MKAHVNANTVKKLLKEYVSLLNEEAISAAQAVSGGLALWVGEFTYFIYDPKKLLEFANTEDKRSRNLPYAGIAVLKVRRDRHDGPVWGTSIVRYSAAHTGYGPLIYNIAMNSEPGLTPDRRIVSDNAHGVWSYYFNKRNDIEAKPLDDIKDPKTPPPEDDAVLHYPEEEVYPGRNLNPLNHSYFKKSPVPGEDKLRANHAKARSKLKQVGIDEYSMNNISKAFSTRFTSCFT